MNVHQAASLYRSAFSDSYNAAQLELIHAWDGREHARDVLNQRLTALCAACQEGWWALDLPSLKAAADVLMRASSLSSPGAESAMLALSLAKSACKLAISTHLRGTTTPDGKAPVTSTNHYQRSQLAQTAVELIKFSTSRLSRDHTTPAEYTGFLANLNKAHHLTSFALTVTAESPLDALRLLVSSSQWTDYLLDELIEILADELEPEFDAVARECLDQCAQAIIDVFAKNFDDLASDPAGWLQQLRRLPPTGWNQSDDRLPSDVSDAALTTVERLTIMLNGLEVDALIDGILNGMRDLDEQPNSARDATSDDETLTDQQITKMVIAIVCLPAELAAAKDNRIVRAIVDLFGYPDRAAAERVAQAIVHTARTRDESRLNLHFLSEFARLDQDQLSDPDSYLSAVADLIDRLPLVDDEYRHSAVLQCNELLYRCSANLRFANTEVARRALELARALMAHADEMTTVRLRHGVIRARWMAAGTDVSEYQHLISDLEQVLNDLGSLPTAENTTEAFVIIESLSFTRKAHQRIDSINNGGRMRPPINVELARALDAGLTAWGDDERVEPHLRRYAHLLVGETEHGDPLDENPLPTDQTEFTTLLTEQPLTTLRRAIAGTIPLNPTQVTELRKVFRQSLAGGSPYISSMLWAELLKKDHAQRLDLADADRISILRLLVESMPNAHSEAAGTLASIESCYDLLNHVFWGQQLNQLSESAALQHLEATIEGDYNYVLAHYLSRRATAAINHIVTAKEWRTRVMAAVASYANALWADDNDGCARAAYIVAEYYRIRGYRDCANWWYSLYDHWCAEGGLSDPYYDNYHRIIAADRSRNTGGTAR